MKPGHVSDRHTRNGPQRARVAVWLSGSERDEISRMAASQGLSLGAWLRSLGLEAAQAAKLARSEVDKQG
jgi:hypothetical protein